MTDERIRMVVVANARIGGRAVYLTDSDGWSPDLGEAEILDDEAHAQLRILHSLGSRAAVGARLVGIRHGPDGPELA